MSVNIVSMSLTKFFLTDTIAYWLALCGFLTTLLFAQVCFITAFRCLLTVIIHNSILRYFAQIKALYMRFCDIKCVLFFFGQFKPFFFKGRELCF